MILELHPKNPNPRDLKKVVEILQKDGVIIVPTDTIYAMACKLDSKKAIENFWVIEDRTLLTAEVFES